MPLPQYGLDNPERVCTACVPVATSVTMSFSSDHGFLLRAAVALSALCQDTPASVVKLGGAHTLVYLSYKCTATDVDIMGPIASGLHNLARHSTLTVWLASIGAIQALVKLLDLSQNHPNSSMIIMDALNALRIFSKDSNKMKVQVISTQNCFPTLLQLTSYHDSGICLVATTMISMLSECKENHQVILNHPGALNSMLLRINNTSDEQDCVGGYNQWQRDIQDTTVQSQKFASAHQCNCSSRKPGYV